MTTRLIIAYSLIALLALTTALVIWWNVHHSARRVDARERAKTIDRYRQREEAATAAREANGDG